MYQANALEIKLSKISLYFSPKVTYPERLDGVQIMKTSDGISHSWAPLTASNLLRE